jgi:DNA-binding NtrC family response regulator
MPEPAVKMLVADDSRMTRLLFRQTAKHAATPIELVEASNGLECMHSLDHGEIDLAFVDVHMPHVSGLETLWATRNRGIKTFVTLMSGCANERCIELARTLRAYEFLFKPFNPDKIEKIVKSYRRLSGPVRVLVADDSSAVRAVIRKVLDNTIFRVEVEDAPDGETALARCQAGGFDIVFLDGNMPGLDGPATLGRLIAHERRIKVVIMSDRSGHDQELDALLRGAIAFLRKPFYPSDVDAILHDLHGICSPNLTSEGTGLVKEFDVAITGRTISIRHKPTGHVYEFLWFRDAPHLRLGKVRENLGAALPSRQVRADAQHAAMLELKHARLVDAVAA